MGIGDGFVCSRCGCVGAKHHGHLLCSKCYNKEYWNSAELKERILEKKLHHKNFICPECKIIGLKHQAKGLCNSCYKKAYVLDPKARIKTINRQRQWYLKIETQVKVKERLNNKYFDGKKYEIFKRDGYTCSMCGKKDMAKLCIHHIDGNGRGSSDPNNDDGNLITVCNSCHIKIHLSMDGWSKKYDTCLSCGTAERKHYALGFCQRCYWRIKRKNRKKTR